MRRQLSTAVGMVVVMTLLCGLAYGLALTGVAQVAFGHRADGSLVHRPFGPRKSGIPESVEMPAPVSTTTRRAAVTRRRASPSDSWSIGPWSLGPWSLGPWWVSIAASMPSPD